MNANSEAQSLWESLGVRTAYFTWIVRGFWPPYFVPGYKKVPFFYKMVLKKVLKKTPSSAKYVTRVRPPSVPELISNVILYIKPINAVRIVIDLCEGGEDPGAVFEGRGNFTWPDVVAGNTAHILCPFGGGAGSPPRAPPYGTRECTLSYEPQQREWTASWARPDLRACQQSYSHRTLRDIFTNSVGIRSDFTSKDQFLKWKYLKYVSLRGFCLGESGR